MRDGELAKFDRSPVGVGLVVAGPGENSATQPALLPVGDLIEFPPVTAKDADDGLGEVKRAQNPARDFVEALIGQLAQELVAVTHRRAIAFLGVTGEVFAHFDLGSDDHDLVSARQNTDVLEVRNGA